MAITDPRVKYVLAKLIDKVSTMFPLSSVFTDMGAAMKLGESIDIPTRSPVTIEKASDSAGLPVAMTVQSNLATANRLTVDQHHGAIVQIPKIHAIFDLEGAWSDQLARQILVELDDFIDIDHWDEAVDVGAWATGSSATYWVNAQGAALTSKMTAVALAKMTNQKGVRIEDLIWVFGPYAIGALRELADFDSDKRQPDGLGVPVVGSLHGVPVVSSQSVRDQKVLTATASQIINASDDQVLTVAAGHGIVPGMLIDVAGFTGAQAASHNGTGKTVKSTTSTTITLSNNAALDDTDNSGGTATSNVTRNGLFHRPWGFTRKRQVPDIKIVDQTGQIGEEMQADALWGVKVLQGACVGLGSPRQDI